VVGVPADTGAFNAHLINLHDIYTVIVSIYLIPLFNEKRTSRIFCTPLAKRSFATCVTCAQNPV
jgi:hypothetical protein